VSTQTDGLGVRGATHACSLLGAPKGLLDQRSSNAVLLSTSQRFRHEIQRMHGEVSVDGSSFSTTKSKRRLRETASGMRSLIFSYVAFFFERCKVILLEYVGRNMITF
jgi:hypothetical protein